MYPGAPEVCDDGVDNDCDGLVDCEDTEDCMVDADGDGYYAPPCGDDCDDGDAGVYPGAPEICDGIDNNCDGVIDEGCAPEVTIQKKVWDPASEQWEELVRVPIGSVLTFKITVQNTGGIPFDAVVTDEMSNQIMYKDDTANIAPASVFSDHRKIIWQDSPELSLDPDEEVEIIFQADAVQLCFGWNTANVTTTEEVSDEVTIPVKVAQGCQPVVDITKLVWDPVNLIWTDFVRCNLGAELEFKIIVNNTAAEPVLNVQVVDDLPSITEYILNSSSLEPDILDPLTWNLGTMMPNERIDIYYKVKAIKDGWGNNSAVVTASLNDCGLSDLDSAMVEIVDYPIVQLAYPKGGETIGGTVTVKWFAIDSDYRYHTGIPPEIYLYFSADDGEHWRQINGVLTNNIDVDRGSYDWDTTSLSDGYYILKVEAVNSHNAIAFDDSEPFIINNGNQGLKVSDVIIQDKTIGSTTWVKDHDTIEISAAITRGYDLRAEDIVADVSCFGGVTKIAAHYFDGFTARWILPNVRCQPSDGELVVSVTAKDLDTKTGVIVADNSPPILNVVKPDGGGFYFFNRKVVPLGEIIIVGPIEIEFQIEDANGVQKAECYVDQYLEEVITENPSEWYWTQKLRGRHQIEIKVYDSAGNSASSQFDVIKIR